MKFNTKKNHNHFDSKSLLSVQRKLREDPKKIIPILYLKDKNICDLGCGNGFYSKYIIQFSSKLYCIDPNKNLLDAAKKYIKANNKKNRVIFINSKISNLPIFSKVIDTALLANIFHHIDFKSRKTSIKEIKRILKPDGILIVIEWKKKHFKSGPSYNLRLTQKECISNFIDLKFKIMKKFNINEQQYCLILKK